MDDLGALIARVKREVPTTDRIPLRRSFKKLPELLGLNESYALIAKGQYDSRIGLVACTDRRVLFVDEGFVYGGNNVDFPYDRITAVESSKGMLHGAIKLHAASAVIVFKEVFPKRRAEEVAAFVRECVHSTGHAASAPVAMPQSRQPDVVDQLKRLGELRDAGVVTPEEFESKKAELLQRL